MTCDCYEDVDVLQRYKHEPSCPQVASEESLSKMLKLVAADLLQGEQKKDVSIGDQKRVALKELNYSMLPAGVTKEETPQKDRKGWENW